MTTLRVPAPLRAKLGDAPSEGLLVMFAEAHRLATESFERRLADESAKIQLQLQAGLANLRAEFLKWCFLFWVGQLAAITGIFSLLRWAGQ